MPRGTDCQICDRRYEIMAILLGFPECMRIPNHRARRMASRTMAITTRAVGVSSDSQQQRLHQLLIQESQTAPHTLPLVAKHSGLRDLSATPLRTREEGAPSLIYPHSKSPRSLQDPAQFAAAGAVGLFFSPHTCADTFPSVSRICGRFFLISLGNLRPDLCRASSSKNHPTSPNDNPRDAPPTSPSSDAHESSILAEALGVASIFLPRNRLAPLEPYSITLAYSPDLFSVVPPFSTPLDPTRRHSRVGHTVRRPSTRLVLDSPTRVYH
jgi:hypothetical protein